MNTGKEIRWEVTEDGCWDCVSHSTDYAGYPRIVRNGRVENMSRFMFKKHKGFISDDTIVRHICDNPKCINPNHLIKGTHKQNAEDRSNRLRTARGDRHGRAKLNEEQVRIIRLDTSHTLTELSLLFGVSYTAIRYVKSRHNWKHI